MAPTLAQLVRRRRLELDWSLAQLASAAVCSKAYLSAIENDRLAHPPSRRMLEAIERALGIEGGELVRLGEWQATPAGVKAEFARLAARRADGAVNLDALYRSGALGRIDQTSAAEMAVMKLTQVPLINKVAAGYPTEFTDLEYPAKIADEYVPYPADPEGLDDADAFAATVVGESMMPEYREGDVIVFSPAREPSDGDDCFVRLLPDHHTTFKRVFFEEGGRVRLQPLNPAFAAAVVEREQVSGIWPAVYRMQRLNGAASRCSSHPAPPRHAGAHKQGPPDGG